MENRLVVEAGVADFLRSGGSAAKSFALSLLPYLARMVTMHSQEITTITQSLLNKQPLDPEFKKKMVDKISGMAVGDAVQYLTTVATQAGGQSGGYRREPQYTQRQPRRPRRASLKCATLSAAELDAYYVGDELPSYCVSCGNSDYAPSGKVGCTIVDDPMAREFLDRFQRDEMKTPDEKCPVFTSAEPAGSDSTLFPKESSSILFKSSGEVRGDMIKEVPMESVEDSEKETEVGDSDPLSLLEMAFTSLMEDPQGEDSGILKEVVRGAIRELKKGDSVSHDQDKDYSYFDQVDEPGEEKIAVLNPWEGEYKDYFDTHEGVMELLEDEDIIQERVLEIYETARMDDGRWYVIWVPEHGTLHGAIVDPPNESVDLVDGESLAKQVNDKTALHWLRHGLEGFGPGWEERYEAEQGSGV